MAWLAGSTTAGSSGFAGWQHSLSNHAGLIVLAVYAGSPTWAHVLMDALDIQQGWSADRLRFNVIARRHGPDRPAGLMLVKSVHTA